MKRTSAALGSSGWLLVAPGTVCGLVPWLITGWRQPGDSASWVDALGWLLVLAGAAVLGHAFVAFAWHGRGTPAPSAPTERLVVEGAYRHVRNPMYVAVLGIVLGQVLLFASWGLFAYLVVLGTTMNAFVRTYEEPTLREAYGPSYEEFCENVPRWLPRLTAWQGAARRPGHRMRRRV
ncbi:MULTISPECIES: methyltransferase family protein [unclassified Geodermatophilus]|uniref:methyltransferase family protein n=1 Tax=unclassified Geodermatophilus TaxID=2637632 RepID=UPI003EE92FB8